MTRRHAVRSTAYSRPGCRVASEGTPRTCTQPTPDMRDERRIAGTAPSEHLLGGLGEYPPRDGSCPQSFTTTSVTSGRVAHTAAIANVLVRRLSLGVLVCDRVWLNRPVGGFVIGVGVGDRLGLVHLARLVVLRRVDGVDLHRLVADVGDVVPAAGRNDDAPAVGYLLVEGQFVLAGSHLGSTAAAVESNELVGVGVLL